MLARYRHGKSLAAFAGFVGVVAAWGLLKPSHLAHFLNPLELHWAIIGAFFLIQRLGLALIDATVGFLVKAAKPLPYRANTGATGLASLEWIDYFYLTVNSMVETVFTFHVLDLVVATGTWRLRDVSLYNTLPALYLVFAIDDCFYAPSHKLMHVPCLYPYVHKHHHRQNLPERGYLDAGNEHPIEQVIGVSCLYASLVLVSKLTGLHALTIIVHFVIYAVLALLNHTNYDIRFWFFGFEYSVAAHEMHHRYPQTNLAQYFMVWDQLMGTYKPYIEGTPKKID